MIPVHAQQECSRTWTLDADFAEGVVINLGSGAGDELVLNPTTTPLPFVYVAASARGTVVRIDINSGAILGEYLTAPNGMGRDPSRTTVDKFGNVWVANRAETGFSGGENKGSVTRIGVIIGGTRGNKNLDGSFTDDPNGQYLRPPFTYSTVTDRDLDGYIKTSKGLTNILAWTNTGGVDTHGGVATADDEAIINYTRVAGSGTRTVAVDANNDVWTSGTGDADHEKISGVTGQPIAGTRFHATCGGYGGLVDGNNVLWSARGPSNLLRYDANTPIPPAVGSDYTCLGALHGDYGLGIDPATGNIWHTNLGGNRVAVTSPAGVFLNAYSHGFDAAQGVAVDGSGNVWVAHSIIGGTTVGHLLTNGTFVGNVALGASGPTGVAVDANGKIWVTNYYSHNVQRIDPNGGAIGGGGVRIGAVDMTVSLGANAYPYNYSDMTGFVTLGGMNPSGTWTVIKDGGIADGEWGVLSWNGDEPAGTDIKVEVRASNDQALLGGLPFLEVENGVGFCDDGISGRYLEIRTTLARTTGTDTPTLYDMTLACCNEPPVAVCRNVTVAAGEDCMAGVGVSDIDDGSYDPDGTGEPQVFLTMSPEGPFALGEHAVTLTVTDVDGAASTCTSTIAVVDQSAPVMTMSTALSQPWPPNHQYITIAKSDIVTAVADNCDDGLGVVDAFIRGATSDELEDANGSGDGASLNDIVIADDCQSVDLRVERDNNGNGRVYRIYCTVVDDAGNVTTESFPVRIRRNNGGSDVAIEDAAVYTVSSDCAGGLKPTTPSASARALGYAIEPSIPNPFAMRAEIPFTIAAPGHVTVSLFDARGRHVAVIFDGERPAGRQSVELDASTLPSGTYYCVLEVAGIRLMQPMTLSR